MHSYSGKNINLDDSGFEEGELDISTYNLNNAPNRRVFDCVNKDNEWKYWERSINIEPVGCDSGFELEISTIFSHTNIRNTVDRFSYLVVEHGCSITKNKDEIHRFAVATEQIKINHEGYFVSSIAIRDGQVLTIRDGQVFNSQLFDSESAVKSKSLDKLSSEALKNPSKEHAINNNNFVIRKAVDSLNKQYKSSKDSKKELIKTDFQKFQEGIPISDSSKARFYIKFGYYEDRLSVVDYNDECKEKSFDLDQAKHYLHLILRKNLLMNEICYSNSFEVIIDILTKFSYFVKDQEDKAVLWEDIEEFMQEELAANNNSVCGFDQIS